MGKGGFYKPNKETIKEDDSCSREEQGKSPAFPALNLQIEEDHERDGYGKTEHNNHQEEAENPGKNGYRAVEGCLRIHIVGFSPPFILFRNIPAKELQEELGDGHKKNTDANGDGE